MQELPDVYYASPDVHLLPLTFDEQANIAPDMGQLDSDHAWRSYRLVDFDWYAYLYQSTGRLKGSDEIEPNEWRRRYDNMKQLTIWAFAHYGRSNVESTRGLRLAVNYREPYIEPAGAAL